MPAVLPPALSQLALNASTVPRPQSSFTARKNALLRFMSLASTRAKAWAVSASVSALRKNHSLPNSVSLGFDDTPVTSGILFFCATGITASVAPLQKAPISADTLSRKMSFSAAPTDSAGLHCPSSITSSSFFPSTPPFALISFAASVTPL